VTHRTTHQPPSWKNYGVRTKDSQYIAAPDGSVWMSVKKTAVPDLAVRLHLKSLPGTSQIPLLLVCSSTPGTPPTDRFRSEISHSLTSVKRSNNKPRH
jgi:hypothetical protein